MMPPAQGATSDPVRSGPSEAAEPPIPIFDPSTGERIAEVPVTPEPEVRQAVARARQAQAAWGALPIPARARQVRRLLAAMIEQSEELADLLMRDCGKTRHEALMFEVSIAVEVGSYFAKYAARLLAPERVPLRLMLHRKSMLYYAPRGVVGIISPWNFPLSIPFGDAFMALLAGNAVVVKPSEVAPRIAIRIAELARAAGLPDGLLQVVNGRGRTGAALIDAGIDMCIFTGSTATGRKIGVACAERLIPCILELGGKSPAIVCADADLDRTAAALVWGGFANAGQACVSVERVYADASIYDALTARIVELTRRLRQAPTATTDEVDIGAMTWDKQLAIVEERVEDALVRGARLLVGGKRRPGGGLFYEPTVLGECTQEMDVMRKEIFGPVLPIMKTHGDDEAVRLANDSDLGLMGYVFTRDRNKGLALARRLEAGTVMVNDVLHTFAAPGTPWGGLKQSGLGRTHSVQAFREMCQLRHINTERFGFSLPRDPYWYPYSLKFYRSLWSTMKLLFWR